MSVEDLDLILKKDPIIATFPASQLRAAPDTVEQNYATHARTHISLGQTDEYVDTIFKWVSGQNKGAFIGAVVGDFGEGKTSFLVHVWAQSQARRVFSVPPMEWASLADAIDGIGGWVDYVLKQTQPLLAKEAGRLYERFKAHGLEESAKETAESTGGDYESTLRTLQHKQQQGVAGLAEITPDRFLDYCTETTEVLKKAGYLGLLVLLDEPELMAKQIGKERATLVLFELANRILQRQGEYGVFLSIPESFYADVSRRYAALPARLQARNCLPRLGNLYGADFAGDLWRRYSKEFELGSEGARVLSEAALLAIGQVGSSDRSDLSFGPRSVISAFKRAVFHFRETGSSYEPGDFVQDCLSQEIMVQQNYAAKVQKALQSPEIKSTDREAVQFLAAFPNGMPIDLASRLGFEQTYRELARRGRFVYKQAASFGLSALAKEKVEGDPLREAILDIDGEFAPNAVTFKEALLAFRDQFLPMLFEPRKGQQLLGWESSQGWRIYDGVHIAPFVGAFHETQVRYPKRAILVSARAIDASMDAVVFPDLPGDAGPLVYDGIFQFRLRWNQDQERPAKGIEIKVTEATSNRLSQINFTMDLTAGDLDVQPLKELLDTKTYSPLRALYLLKRMESEQLPRESDAQWQAVRTIILRMLVAVLLPAESAVAASEQLPQSVTGSGLSLVGSVFARVLQARYPRYSTLISGPQWQGLADDYIRALNSVEVPLACKRGREAWRPRDETAGRVLGAPRMNLSGGHFQGLSSLIAISTAGRSEPLVVEFHTHPLEQEIADLVCSGRCGADRRLKIDGKDCWWVPMTDILPVIKAGGYTTEELHKIVDIGRARGSFDITERKGERVVFCKPIDPEQMRSQLQAKLQDLVVEIDEYKKLPDFVSTFDVQGVARDIMNVKDEADHEHIATRLNKEFEQLHQRLPAYFDRLQGELMGYLNEAKRVGAQLVSSREMSLLAKVPTSTVSWGESLGKYIVGNLRHAADDLKASSNSLVTSAEKAILKYKHKLLVAPQENLNLLTEGMAVGIDLGDKARSVGQRLTEFVSRVRDYEEWLKLLSDSDQLWVALLDLQVHNKATADPLVAEVDGLSKEISAFLEVRNVEGLGSYKQYSAKLDEIDKRRRGYLANLKAEFDRKKEAVNLILASLKLDRRVNVVFNPIETDGSYRALYDQGVANLREAAVALPVGEIETQERELTYIKNILRSLDAAEVDPILEKLGEARARLAQAAEKIATEWLKTIVDSKEHPDLKALVDANTEAEATVRESSKRARDAVKTKLPDDPRAKAMFEQLPQAGTMDLKDVILRMMPSAADPSKALDESLACLVELFRSNAIQVKVERRRDSPIQSPRG